MRGVENMLFKKDISPNVCPSMGKILTDLRKKHNMTQEQLAERLGVSPQAVSKWENDASCPDIAMLPVIANEFGITIDELFGRRESEVSANPDIDSLILKIAIQSVDGDCVNVNLPMSLVKAALSISRELPQFGDKLKDIDLDQIIYAVENGFTGKIVDIKSADGDMVEIVVE